MRTPESDMPGKGFSIHRVIKALESPFSRQSRKEDLSPFAETDWRHSQVIETKDGLNAISPGENAFRFGISEWKSWLKVYIDGFKDDPTAPKGSALENAAIMMKSLAQGVDYMHSRHVTGGNQKFKRPPLFIMEFGDDLMGPNIGYWRTDKLVAIKNSMLHEASSIYRMDTVEEIRSGVEAKTVFIGTIPQWLTYEGIEECDHAEYQQFHEKISSSKRTSITKLAEYDAQTHELRALLEQKSYAETHGFLPKEIALINRRIEAANLYKKIKS